MARPQPTPTPVKTAFAGSTFNASPAPSALPLPKLFAKSGSANAGQRSLDARLQHEQQQQQQQQQQRERDTPPASSPTRDGSQIDGDPPAPAPSPLDIFFRADQEEKARARRALEAAPSPSQRHSLGSSQLPEDTLNISPSPTQRHGRPPTDDGSTDMLAVEMDGDTPSQPPSNHLPASSTPLRPAEVVRAHTAPGTMEMGQLDEAERLRRQSEMLKALLKRPPQSPHDSPSPLEQHQQPCPDRVGPPIFGPRPHATPPRTHRTPPASRGIHFRRATPPTSVPHQWPGGGDRP